MLECTIEDIHLFWPLVLEVRHQLHDFVVFISKQEPIESDTRKNIILLFSILEEIELRLKFVYFLFSLKLVI